MVGEWWSPVLEYKSSRGLLRIAWISAGKEGSITIKSVWRNNVRAIIDNHQKMQYIENKMDEDENKKKGKKNERKVRLVLRGENEDNSHYHKMSHQFHSKTIVVTRHKNPFLQRNS